ncbi:MAG TPA: hypothetical protein VLJ15_01105 [Gammaproteobacteria bacterium]|nr:hypothetical protein [Gammaproteobacteria bacterium]
MSNTRSIPYRIVANPAEAFVDDFFAAYVDRPPATEVPTDDTPAPKKAKRRSTAVSEPGSIKAYLARLSQLREEEKTGNKKRKELSSKYATYDNVWVFVHDQQKELTPDEVERVIPIGNPQKNESYSKTAGSLIINGVPHAVATIGFLRRPENNSAQQHRRPNQPTLNTAPALASFGVFQQPPLPRQFPASFPVLSEHYTSPAPLSQPVFSFNR